MMNQIHEPLLLADAELVAVAGGGGAGNDVITDLGGIDDSRYRKAAARTSCQNNLKQMALPCIHSTIESS